MKHKSYQKPGFNIQELVFEEDILQASGDAGSLINNDIDREQWDD